ncbi:GPN-loop GTPase 1 [Babesia sp. Xinjiang]|uniref:GPN-loop GTPase 1 n=1 Tax=Babesia sp. Xinjiang TaxID=462227 RepID=UPI000A24A09A|nr:GPN-loop GTPase 1 [Babesia sp. Xinjiang]ORM39879.1 GPN-loop GTPase 1 [Babesia sp. Xinjiang]
MTGSGSQTSTTQTQPEVTHDMGYYAKCMFGGVLSCGITHTLVTPLDVTKCRMQTNPKMYTGLISGAKTIYHQEGLRGLTRGWQPTLVGYSFQGLGKFGLYEMFKDLYAKILGIKNDKKSSGTMWLAASASAEFFADVLLCPWEMVKVKVQTAPRAEQWSDNLFVSANRMWDTRKTTQFPFGSLQALWSRQIPYTMAKFYFFEKIASLFYEHLLKESGKDTSKATQLGVTFASGYLAGIICAIVSHPADNLISQLGKEQNKGKQVMQICKEMGLVNLFTRGLGTRVLMIGTLTGLQWWIYDTFKSIVGLPTSAMCDVSDDVNLLQRPVAAKGRNTLAIVVIGMAGSGKTCYVRALIDRLKSDGKKVYSINLDPAVTKIPYTPNIGKVTIAKISVIYPQDIRESIKYRHVMKKYRLGPNGAIMTCLNLFVTRFDKVLEILDRRCAKLDYIVIDTPGQIEVFNWSASGTVILESLASSFPTTVNYVIDTCRSQLPVTFMANMVYACSVMYKSRVPFIACFNKIDIDRHEKCLEWMDDYNAFYDAVMQDDSYMASFSRSCALMLNEFYSEIKCNGISSITGEGFDEHIRKLDECREEYKTSYLPWLEECRMRHCTEQMSRCKLSGT